MDIPDELVRAFCERRAILFVAAGCSIPSGIPSADELAEQVALAAYAGQTGISLQDFKVREFGSNHPTLDEIAECFLQRYGSLDQFCKLIQFSDWLRPPNDAQEGLVRLALEDFYDSVITINWDTLIETAASNLRCRLAAIRDGGELDLSADVDLRLFKIHGCSTSFPSVVAATSQIEDDSQYFWWARPQVEAAFQGCCVVFVGYSGSIKRITKSMARLAEWSPKTVKKYVVDRSEWTMFSGQASDFVSTAGLTENEFFNIGAEEFMRALVDRLIRQLVLEAVHEEGPNQFDNLLELIPGHGQEEFRPDTVFIDSIASGHGAESMLRAMLRRVQEYPPVRSNGGLLARAVAWTSYLSARGWMSVPGTPLMRKDDLTVYLAAGELGSPASKVARHVLEFRRRRNRSHADIVIGDQTREVICVLLGVTGTVEVTSMGNLTTDSPASDLTRGERENLRFVTESEFLREAEAA